MFYKDKITEICSKSSSLLFNGKYDEARDKIEEYLDNNPISFDKNVEYHYFNSFAEEVIFDFILKKNDSFVILDKNYPSIFDTYANILFELDEYSKARTYLLLANKLNPLNFNVIFSLVRVYDFESRGDLIHKILTDSLKIVHDKYNLFDIYQRLGEYYKQIGDYKIAEILLSLKNENSFNKYNKMDLINLFDEYEISLGFNTRVISAISHASHLSDKKGNFGDSYNFYQDSYDLSKFNKSIFD